MNNELILHIAIYDSEKKKRHTSHETAGHSCLVKADPRGQ